MKSRLKKLRIVFALDAHVSATQVLGDRTFGRLTATDPLDLLGVFHEIKGTLEQLGIPPVFRIYEGTVISERRIKARFGKYGIPYLRVEGLALQAGDIPAWRQSYIIVEETSLGAAPSWDQWVSPFLGWPNFVQAWIADGEYNHWQNASDPNEYKVVGRDMSGLKMKSNNMPPPLKQDIVDTSKNPGRWEFRQGYIEAIGALMWIGGNLWQAIGEDRESELRALNWLHLTEPQKGILRVASDFPFTDETTASQQNALRAAIYGSGQQNN